MIANYHTHTVRCRHAVGAEEEYIRCGMEAGLTHLGFSDHTPYLFPGGYYSTYRMYPEQLDDYVDTVLALKDKYRDRLQIHLGLEAEYYPKFFPELLQLLREYPMEYLILGQHFVGSEIGEPYSGRPTADPQILIQYCDQVIEAMYTGLFSCLAHPELLNFRGDDKLFSRHMRRVCKAANACGIPLEINFEGMRGGRHYPAERFWRLAAEENCSVVLGCDAHDPQGVCDWESEEKAMRMVETYDLQLLADMPLRSL